MSGGPGRAPRRLLARIDRTARDVFGYAELGDDERDAIAAVAQGRDTLVVMPTGSGKSAVYQIAGLIVPGGTVVVSPLLALQRDQVRSLRGHGVDDTGEASSAVPEGERRGALDAAEEGDVEFLFLAPEQFTSEDAHASLVDARPSLFVVDEAHCISAWGHDFRPDYLRLGGVIEALGHPTVLALTATAAPPVRRDIVGQLGMRDPQVVMASFDRPNLWLEARRFHDEPAKREAVVEAAAHAAGPGIVYAATRRATEEIARSLTESGRRARPYHAGLGARQRRETQDAFMSGDLDVIVATVAFGMGIDKPDVRFVVHHDVPPTLDAYYQEIGRAGRDGEPADAILFHRPEDLGRSRFLATPGRLSEDDIGAVVDAVVGRGPGRGRDIGLDEVAERSGVSRGKVRTALGLLEQAGVIRTLPGDLARPAEGASEPGDSIRRLARAEEATGAIEASRVEMMRAYAETRDCRRQFLLNYFGEDYRDPCGACDNCAAGSTVAEAPSDEQPFALGARVSHGEWGEGVVMRYEGDDKLVVLFDDAGYKTLSAGLVVDRDLLRAVDPPA